MSLSAADEALLKRYYECKILSLCGRASETSELRRPEQAAATSIRLFQRFYAATSVAARDPRAIMAAAVFLGAKSENAFVRPRALEENLGVDEQALLDAELALLDGTDYELLFKHPYPSARGFVENAARFFASDALTEEADALAEVRRWRCAPAATPRAPPRRRRDTRRRRGAASPRARARGPAHHDGRDRAVRRGHGRWRRRRRRLRHFDASARARASPRAIRVHPLQRNATRGARRSRATRRRVRARAHHSGQRGRGVHERGQAGEQAAQEAPEK